jgi:hypothetical protein
MSCVYVLRPMSRIQIVDTVSQSTKTMGWTISYSGSSRLSSNLYPTVPKQSTNDTVTPFASKVSGNRNKKESVNGPVRRSSFEQLVVGR